MKNKSLGSAVISMSYIILGREKNIDYNFTGTQSTMKIYIFPLIINKIISTIDKFYFKNSDLSNVPNKCDHLNKKQYYLNNCEVIKR